MLELASNINTAWAQILVDELANNGVQDVVIAPGSRSTSLTLAFWQEEQIRIHRHLDERSAGFFALGRALESGQPVALVCTSGTAAANYYPAIIEANQSGIPLLVLTADRPPELQDTSANQTIDQQELYGRHVRWSVNLLPPNEEAKELIHRYIRTIAARAHATAAGNPAGPVHLNIAFRKPLEPSTGFEPTAQEPISGLNSRSIAAPRNEDTKMKAPPRMSHGLISPTAVQMESIAAMMDHHTKGLILCGPRCPEGDFPSAVRDLAATSGYPIVADALSGVRYGPHTTKANLLGSYDSLLQAAPDSWPEFDLIIRFGALPVSAALGQFLGSQTSATQLIVRADGRWADEHHLVDHYYQVDPALFCRHLTAELRNQYDETGSQLAMQLLATEAATIETIDRELAAAEFFDGMAVNMVLHALPSDAVLFAGNSLPVRHVDFYAAKSHLNRKMIANRGASGIDGNISTALGYSVGTDRPMVALLGDITFYHDMNGLLPLLDWPGRPPVIIVLNNNGGGIFRRLPVARFEPPFEELFTMAHGMTFAHVAAQYGLNYECVTNREQLGTALKTAFGAFEDPLASHPGNRPAMLIEVMTNAANDLKWHRRIVASITRRLNQLPDDIQFRN